MLKKRDFVSLFRRKKISSFFKKERLCLSFPENNQRLFFKFLKQSFKNPEKEEIFK
jgi:hypothetical protein